MSNFTNFLKKWGNHVLMVWIWALIGSVCTFFAPFYMMKTGDDATIAQNMLQSFVVCVILYIIGWRLRYNKYMRNRRGWMGTVVMNCFVSGVSLIMTVHYHVSTKDVMIGKLLIAVAVFGFMEIAKPIFDFGLVQFFLRLPLQTACMLAFESYFVLMGLILVLGTLWQAFFTHFFVLATTDRAPQPLNRFQNVIGEDVQLAPLQPGAPLE